MALGVWKKNKSAKKPNPKARWVTTGYFQLGLLNGNTVTTVLTVWIEFHTLSTGSTDEKGGGRTITDWVFKR